MKLNKPITIRHYPYTDINTNKIVTPEPTTFQVLNVTYFEQPHVKNIAAQIEGVQNVITLFFGQEYDALGDTRSLSMLENRLNEIMGPDPEVYLQGMIPRTIEADPNGPGTILTNMIKSIGIKSSPTCSCRRHAVNMNVNGPDWCENNEETILSWLEEESQKRNIPFVKSVARLMVHRAIKRSRKLLSKEG